MVAALRGAGPRLAKGGAGSGARSSFAFRGAVAWVVAGVLGACGGDEGGAGADTSASGDLASETSDALETVTPETVIEDGAVDSDDGNGGDGGDEASGPEVVTGPPLPGLAQALLLTPGDGLGTVRVQPTLAWDRVRPGRLAIAWTGAAEGELGIFAGAWDVGGEGARPVGEPRLVHVDRAGIRNESSICARAGGGFAIVWSIDTQAGPDNLRVAWRMLDGAAVPIGEREVVVETERAGNHWLAEVACRPEGGFVVAGVRPGAGDAGFAVFAQRYDDDGLPEGDAFAAFEREAGGQAFPVVGVGPGDGLWLAWEDAPAVDAAWAITARAFPVGADAGALLTVVGDAGGDAQAPVLAVDPSSGRALVGGVLDNGLRVALLGPEVGATPAAIALPDQGPSPTTSSAAVARGGDRFSLVWFRGVASRVEVRHADLAGGAFGAATTVAIGSFPLAYRPALAVDGDHGAIGWTESLGGGAYAIQVALYRP